MYDFANLLFSGPCNARCYFCIGRQIDPALSPDNLSAFPLRNLEIFIALIQQCAIRQVVFTGTNTDPQLYRHEARLLSYLRERLPPETRFSLHTNGRLALRKIEVFNHYDRATISLPGFDPGTYFRMMGVPGPPDLSKILRQARIPVKVSCLVTAENAPEISQFLVRCRDLGVQRIVLRKRFGGISPWDQTMPTHELVLTPQAVFRGNPVYDFQGMEVTLWDFEQTTSKSINLFSSGVISRDYLLAEAQANWHAPPW